MTTGSVKESKKMTEVYAITDKQGKVVLVGVGDEHAAFLHYFMDETNPDRRFYLKWMWMYHMNPVAEFSEKAEAIEFAKKLVIETGAEPAPHLAWLMRGSKEEYRAGKTVEKRKRQQGAQGFRQRANCNVCGAEGSVVYIARCHSDRCKKREGYVRPPEIRETCVHCGLTGLKGHIDKAHNDRCAFHPDHPERLVTPSGRKRVMDIKKCPHCGEGTSPKAYTRWHGDKCKKKKDSNG